MNDPNTLEQEDARFWAALCHVSALLMLLIPVGGNVLGPAVVWLVKGSRDPFIDAQGKEALNFNITMTLYYVAAGLLVLIFIGILLLPVLFVAHIVLCVIAGIKARDGVAYRYPFTVRLID